MFNTPPPIQHNHVGSKMIFELTKTLKMGKKYFVRKLVHNCRTTNCDTPEGHNLIPHCLGSLKSSTLQYLVYLCVQPSIILSQNRSVQFVTRSSLLVKVIDIGCMRMEY